MNEEKTVILTKSQIKLIAKYLSDVGYTGFMVRRIIYSCADQILINKICRSLCVMGLYYGFWGVKDKGVSNLVDELSSALQKFGIVVPE